MLVKDPIIENVTVTQEFADEHAFPSPGPRTGKAINITIPIEEGARYRMGTIHVRNANPDEGLFFKTDFLEGLFPLKKGDIFSVAKVRKAIQDYTKLYGNYGFIDFTAVPDTDVHDDTKTIDLTFAFDQQKQFFVRRIEFSGNTGTRDKVIRRELLLSEGDMFRNNLWELSLLRLNQLDYFEAVKPENAEIKRNVKQGTVDILLKLKEKGKQSISLTGGVSGFAGSYIGLDLPDQQFPGPRRNPHALCERRHPAARHLLRLHRALSVRPADQHRLHHILPAVIISIRRSRLPWPWDTRSS